MNHPDSIALIQQVNDAMDAHQMADCDLARIIGCHRSSLCEWRNGSRSLPSLEYGLRLNRWLATLPKRRKRKNP